MKAGDKFPKDQAEIVFNDAFVEYLESLTARDKESVLVDVLTLSTSPVGSHRLSNRSSTDRLAGWNTLDVLAKEHRVVFASRIVDGVGVIEVLCAGPRKADAAYDMANALVRSGTLTEQEATDLWQALALLDLVAEEVGLDGWDYRPPAGPEGMIQSVVKTGLLDEVTARLLSKDELEAAMEGGWASGTADPAAALQAAMRRARAGVDTGDLARLMQSRAADRCGALLPRAGSVCIRRADHPGPHRSS